MNLPKVRAITLPMLAPVCLLAVTGLAQAQDTERVSAVHNVNNRFGTANPAGGQSTGGYTTPSGRYTVFASAATNLIAGDGNARQDVFVRDRWTNTTVRVSVPTPSLGGESNGASTLASGGARVMSDDGRYVIFESDADNLVSGDTNGVTDIFVHDRDADNDGIFDEPGVGNTRTTRVNLSTAGGQSTGTCPNQTCTHYSNDGVISADGRFIAWSSPYNFSSDSAAFTNVFWRDRDTDIDGIFDEAGAVETRLASKRIQSSSVGQSGDGASGNPAISADGRHVAFESLSRFMVFSDSVQNQEIFARDMVAGVTARITMPPSGNNSNQPDGVCHSPSISGNGRFIAFASTADNLAAGVNTGTLNVLVIDRDNDNDGILDEVGAVVFEDVSQYPAPLVLPGQDAMTNLNGSSSSPMITDDGQYVVFASDATNFGACLTVIGQPTNPACTDTTAHDEVFVYHRPSDNLIRASLTRDGQEPDADCSAPSISGNGRWVTFRSAAANLDDAHAAGLAETFVRSMWAASNEDCGSAEAVAAGQTVAGDNYATDGEGEGVCTTTRAAAWYSLTPACTGNFTIDTAGSPFDTVLTVYAGPCPATSNKLLACNDDAASPAGTYHSAVTVSLTAGQAYVIRVGGYLNDAGRFTLNISPCNPCPADFNQSGAVTVQDIFDFLAAYFSNAAAADFNNSGSVSVQDIFDYLAAYFAGCV